MNAVLQTNSAAEDSDREEGEYLSQDSQPGTTTNIVNMIKRINKMLGTTYSTIHYTGCPKIYDLNFVKQLEAIFKNNYRLGPHSL